MIAFALAATCAIQKSPIVNLTPIPFTEVTIDDRFWSPRQRTNREVSIPHTFDQCEKTGRLANFDLAAKGARTGFKGLIFDDSDVYKSLEAAAYALAEKRDPVLEKRVDEMIARVAAAQRPDGYLNTWYEINAPDKVFTNLADNHELYCAGHLFEAAVAHFQATGKKTLLNVATKYADLLCRTFGDEPGQRMGYCGHPESELALMKLWRATGEQRYFDLAAFFLNRRGSRFFADERKVPKAQFDGTYWLDDVPLRDHREIKGHAVRAAYLFSGAADLAAATRDEALRTALDRVWRNTVFRRVFVTGGIGPSGSNEGFTVDYDLPTYSAYQETCASVAMILWNHRMGLMEGDAKYWDWVERALYNGFLAGVSLEGTHFFYVNPLASRGNHARSEWFGCACCPPNVTRLLASLGSYLYAKSGDTLYVNLFVAGKLKTKLGDDAIELTVETDYPWDGKVVLRPRSASGKPFPLRVRVPEWSGEPKLTQGVRSVQTAIDGGYLVVPADWRAGEALMIEFPMRVQRVIAHPAAKDLSQRAAIQRGPLVYCLETNDNPNVDLSRVILPADAVIKPERSPDLGGIVKLIGNGFLAEPVDWRRRLYADSDEGQPVALTAIPYYAWDNRGNAAMVTWLPTARLPESPGGLERSAKVSLSFTSGICTPTAINDGRPIEGSNKHPGDLCHFWPHKGTEEWVEYAWAKPVTIDGVEVYWFDDTGFGECRPPTAWWIEAKIGTEWKRVEGSYGLGLNTWNRVKFPALTTSSLRLKLKLQSEWSVGIHEWKILEPDED